MQSDHMFLYSPPSTVVMMIVVLLYSLSLLLLLAGDVELNPGPRLDTILTLSDLLEVYEKARSAGPDWFNLGLVLRLSYGKLTNFRDTYRDNDVCLREVLAHRLQSGGTLTWGDMCTALRHSTVERNDVAEAIEESCERKEFEISQSTNASETSSALIVNSPPTQTFMSGSVLHMSATSQPPVPSQVPPTARREAWGVPDTPTDRQLPGNASPHLEKPVTAPVRLTNRPPVPHRRHFTSDGTDGPSSSNIRQHTPLRLNQPQWHHQGDQYSHHQGQQEQQSYNGPMHHSASYPDSVGAIPVQQLPYPPHRYPPYSGQPQWGAQGQDITVQSGAPIQPVHVQGSQQGPPEAAHHPPANAMATAPTRLCRKVKVSDLPKEARNLKFYFQSLAGPVASVEMFKDSAVITLENPTSMDWLIQLSRTTPLEPGVVLALSALEPSDTVLVSGLNDTTPDVLVKLMLADYIKQHDSVESVKRISPTHALVIFKSPDNVQKITSKPLIEVEGLQLSVKEYYPFMDTSEILDPSSTKQEDPLKPNDPPTPTQVVHSPQRDPLTKEQHFYLNNNLLEFNDTLQSLKACADIEKVGKYYFVVISPLEGSGSIDEWKDKVAAALKEHFEEFSIETIDFPNNKEAKLDIQDIIYDQTDSVLVVKRKLDSFIIAGSKEIITEICEKATIICLQYQVTIRAIELPRKRVKFLEKFYYHKFQKLVNKTSVHAIQFNTDNGLITVTANPPGHTEVDKVIKQKNTPEEKSLLLSRAAYKLLSSRRGANKLKKVFDISGPQIVYDMEQVQIPGDVQYYICFLSKDAEVLKKVIKSLKLYVHEVAFETSPAKIQLCSSKEWRLFIATLSEEHFVSITAQEDSSWIIITGEKLACNGISERVQRFLEKHNIEERVTVSQSEWFVVNKNFSNEVNGINDQAKKKQVKIEWPKPKLKVSSLPIVISGEPLVVDNIKVEVTMLLQKVCKKESRITGVPAVGHVLESMDDKLRLLETDERVRIEVTLENGDNNELEAAAQVEGELPQQVCAGTSPSGSRVSVYTGDFAQNAPVGVIVNFITSDPNTQVGCLKHLLESGGADAMEDFKQKVLQFMELKPGEVFKTRHGQLNCSQLVHCVLPSWRTAESNAIKEYFLELALYDVMKDAAHSGSILITPLTSAPLHYPVNTFVRLVIDAVTHQTCSDLQVSVYVEELHHANEFRVKMQLYRPAPPTAVAPPIGSTTLIIAQGNIAEESTDIIVNTTSEDMTLNKSAVSKEILAKAGKQYVENGMRLDHGQIVVTPAVGKLRCRKIIHAHVPHQGSIAKSSTHQLIEKIVIDCLHKAEHEKMKSISFPAFGLGGGGYSVEQVAEPMLKAFQKFWQTHPQSVKSIRVVIYDPELYKQFNDFYCKFFGHSSLDTRPPPSLWNRLVGSSHKVNSESQELQERGVASLKAPPIWDISHSIPNPIVVFAVFGASDAQCEKIADTLKKLIKEKSTTKTITGAHIEQLTDDYVKEIVQIGDKHGVHVKMVAIIKEIRISGETSKVLGAHSEIQKILSDIERSMIELRGFEWLSADDDGRYEAYLPEASMRLERAFNKGLKAIELTVDNVVVVMDIQNNIETDKTNGKTRKIIRARKAVHFPSTWTGDKKVPMTRIEVDSGTPEYIEAVKEFEESLTKGGVKYSIEKIERIENITEYAKHVALKDCIREKHKKDPLVKRLFYGSKKDSTVPIAVQGFNRNFAADPNAAHFGRGVYFAVEPSYSAQDKYSVPDSSGLRYMFVCRVIIGEYTLGNRDMKTAPPLTPGSKELFDTLVDNVKFPTIFVAMSDAQAYPEYLITFKKFK